MKINEVLTPKLPVYRKTIQSLGEWETIRDSGEYDKTKIVGSLNMNNQGIKVLKGLPSKIGKEFGCSSNYLISLQGCPDVINDFNCSYNKLISLEGGPSKIFGDYLAHGNKLTSLKGSPIEIPGDFSCEGNELINLIGAPRKVLGTFNCYQNQLITLEGAPEYIGGGFYCRTNNLSSLQNIHKIIKHAPKLGFGSNPIKSHVLGILLIDGIENVFGDQSWLRIINNHIHGDKDVLECQEEMISAGYKAFAKL